MPSLKITLVVKRFILFASVGCYLSSLWVPAFYVSDGKSILPWSGAAALISSLFGWMVGFYCALANPIIFILWFLPLIKRPLVVLGVAIFAFVLCLSFLGHHTILLDEGGNKGTIVGPGLGFWLWSLSPALMIIHGLVALTWKTVATAASPVHHGARPPVVAAPPQAVPNLASRLIPYDENHRTDVRVDFYKLEEGRAYVVIRAFTDCYGGAFMPGERLTYVSRHFLPYAGGYTIVFNECSLYLQEDRDRAIIDAFGDYVAEVKIG